MAAIIGVLCTCNLGHLQKPWPRYPPGHMPTARRPPRKRTARRVSPSDMLDILHRLDDIEKTLSVQFQRMAAMQAQIDHNAARLRS